MFSDGRPRAVILHGRPALSVAAFVRCAQWMYSFFERRRLLIEAVMTTARVRHLNGHSVLSHYIVPFFIFIFIFFFFELLILEDLGKERKKK